MKKALHLLHTITNILAAKAIKCPIHFQVAFASYKFRQIVLIAQRINLIHLKLNLKMAISREKALLSAILCGALQCVLSPFDLNLAHLLPGMSNRFENRRTIPNIEHETGKN